VKPSSAKGKGRIFQQWVRDRIIDKFSLHPDNVKSTSMGAGGEDVQLSPEARKYFPYQIEAKSRDKMAIYGFYEQAQAHGPHEAVVFVKMNRMKPLVVVDAEHFIDLVKRAHDGTR
jgi:hypothetical protein